MPRGGFSIHSAHAMLVRMRTVGVFVVILFTRTLVAAPNFLWISAEDLSPDLHCYGDDYAITPNLDRFAQQGVRFTRAFSTAPVCSPSRCSIITGMYATTVGGHNHRSHITPA